MATDNPLTRKLEWRIALTGPEIAALDRLAGLTPTLFPARRDVAREGDAPRVQWLILEGWAARYKLLPDGRRQIVGFLLPGDLWGTDALAMERLDHSLSAISALRCVAIPQPQMEAVMRSPGLRMALQWERMTTAAIEREWIASLGQRSAPERIANLLCELYLRLEMTGHATGGRCLFPVTQRDLAGATGLSTVHVNRVLKELRQRGLIAWRGRNLHIPDLEALMDQALFSATFLMPRQLQAAL